LVVLVPGLELDEVELARRVWEFASTPHLAVLFLALCEDEQGEMRIRRRLATLTALTRDDRIVIETHLDYGRNWMRKVKDVLQEGDIVICYANQTVDRGQKLLHELLAEMGVAVWPIKGLDVTSLQARRKPLKELLFWPGSVAIIAACLWLQIQILTISEIWAQNTLLYLSIPFELGLLWFWNYIFG
jgi:hypothetical protein